MAVHARAAQAGFQVLRLRQRSARRQVSPLDAGATGAFGLWKGSSK